MANPGPGGLTPPGQVTATSGYPQYGVSNPGGDLTKSGDVITVASNATQKGTATAKLGILDWFTSRQAAQEFISGQESVLGNDETPSDLIPKWSLIVSGISGWFVRGLKMLFGGVLMIMAILHLTGASNKVTEVAGKAIPLLAA